MWAFVEQLCEHCGIVRAGPVAFKYGDPWQAAITYRLEEGYAVIKGLASTVTGSQYRDIIRAINGIGHPVAYVRAGNPAYSLLQTDPRLTKGRIVMKKHPHHATDAINTDGSISHGAIEAGIAHWMKEIKEGRCKIMSVGEVAIDANHDILWFVRETK